MKRWQIPLTVVACVVAPAASSLARSSHASSSGGDFSKFIGIGVLLLVGLAFVAINATKKPKPVSQEELERQKAEALDFLDKANKGNFTPPDTPLVLAAGEVALLHESSQLIEARASRVYAGGGTRIQGIYIGGGQSKH